MVSDMWLTLLIGEKMEIHMNISFPKVPCELLTLDVMDVSGEIQTGVMHGVNKVRLASVSEGGRDISTTALELYANTNPPNLGLTNSSTGTRMMRRTWIRITVVNVMVHQHQQMRSSQAVVIPAQMCVMPTLAFPGLSVAERTSSNASGSTTVNTLMSNAGRDVA